MLTVFHHAPSDRRVTYRRAFLLQAQHLVAVADLTSQIVQTQRLGTLTGSIQAQTGFGRYSGTPERGATSFSGSLNYQVNLFDAGRLDSSERQAVARAEAQRAALNQTVATVQQLVAANWAQVQIARATILASDQQIRATQSAYDAVRAEAELGSRTTLDVLNAEQELLNARSARIYAAAGLQTAAYALLQSTGQLTVQSLGLGIPTYDVEAYSATLRREPPRETPSEQGRRLDRIMGRFGPQVDR